MKRIILSVMTVFLLVSMTVLGCAFLSSAEDAFIDLTSLSPKNVKVGWGSLAVNKGLDGQSLDMTNKDGGTTVYPKGFTAHADSSVEFDIEGLGAVIFRSAIGAEHSNSNATPSSTSVKFLVYADNQLLYTSPVLGYYDPAIEISVPLPAGSKVLKLVTDSCGSNTGDHSAWGNPQLLMDASLLEKMVSLNVTTGKNVYKTGETVQIQTECTNLGGSVFTPEKLTFVSSDSTKASVDSTGKITSFKDGLVRFTVKAEHQGVTIEKTIAITFMSKIEEKDFSISSPSDMIKVDLKLDGEGALYYTVTGEDGISVLEKSYIGINTEFCDFSNALVFKSQVPVSEFDDTYHNISGKASTVRNHYNQTVLTFKKDVYLFDVYLRAYDDGFAYRFAIRRNDGQKEELTVVSETGTFGIPEKSIVTAEYIDTVTSSFCYESSYSNSTVENISKAKFVCMPALVSVYNEGAKTNKYLLISEADMFGDNYSGMVMKANGDNVFGMTFAPKVTYNSTVKITTDFTSPWRYGIYGDIGDIVESNLTENLATPSEGDYSWVVPGVTAWMWLSEGFQGQRTEKTIKDYVDLAAEMGWKYLILDEGWQPESRVPGKKYNGYYPYFDRLLQYAEEKGVGFIAWVKYCDLDTPEERQVLVEWANKGIKGIKADFFDSEDPDTLAGFKAIYEMAADNHLIVNCHGASKPTGERHTYPNVLNREAVNGEEYGGFWVNQAVIWAYTRNVIGPIDITPRLKPSASGNTYGVQLACNVIFECGMPCMASDSEEYRSFNANSFYKNLPAAWDETRYLDGTVGGWISMARRSGDTWYAASISNAAKTDLTMKLDFLSKGKTYTATIYNDKSMVRIEETTMTVTSEDTLSYRLLRQGGYVVKFEPVDDPNPPTPTVPPTSEAPTVPSEPTLPSSASGETVSLESPSADASSVSPSEGTSDAEKTQDQLPVGVWIGVIAAVAVIAGGVVAILIYKKKK